MHTEASHRRRLRSNIWRSHESGWTGSPFHVVHASWISRDRSSSHALSDSNGSTSSHVPRRASLSAAHTYFHQPSSLHDASHVSIIRRKIDCPLVCSAIANHFSKNEVLSGGI